MLGVLVRFLLAVSVALGAAAPVDGDASYFAARRETVMKRIPESIALLQGAVDTRAYVPFRQNNDFYYLSGVETPGAFLLIDAVQRRSLLFLPPRNAMLESSEGPRMTPGEDARAATGVDEVLEVSRLEGELEKRKAALRHIYTPLRAEETAATSRDRASMFDRAQERNAWDGRISREKAFAAGLSKKLGEAVEIRDLSPVLDSMRRVKDGQEIERLRGSGRIGARGIAEAMRAVRAGDYEYQIASVAEFVFKWSGATHYAYFPVVGSGPNSCILHYHANTRRTEAGDIVVMDFAPDFRYYHSDITRSFPVSGRFSDEQARVYRVVLDAQKAALGKVRPGATFAEIGAAAREVVRREGYDDYWRHGVSHYVGMSTHDVGGFEPLEAGVVLTVEPGVYIPGKSLGVRIEDTVLVTPDGCEILTKDVPKEIGEVEKLMAEAGTLSAPRPSRR